VVISAISEGVRAYALDPHNAEALVEEERGTGRRVFLNSRANEMREKTSLGGSFTFPGTSLTANRVGYGAMQLAGQDGDKRVWGPPRDIPRCDRGSSARLSRRA
jgi:hypothetical protein